MQDPNFNDSTKQSKMTEDQDDKPLEDLTGIQSETPSADVPQVTNIETVSTNESTDNMEVHHHTHHDHQKRNWKSYFWEFLMLFLAVFCGYLAESYHTHSINKDIERRNMELVVDNLREDVEKLKSNIRYQEQKVKVLDTLISFRDIKNADTLNSQTFGYLFSKSIYNPIFVSNMAAIDQMKSSGSLRLVKSKEVLEGIFRYVGMNNLLSTDRDRLNHGDDLWIENASAFLDMQNVARSREVSFLENSTLKHRNTLPGSQQSINQFFNLAIIRKSILEVLLLPRMHEQQKNGEDLIELLEKEYHIQKD